MRHCRLLTAAGAVCLVLVVLWVGGPSESAGEDQLQATGVESDPEYWADLPASTEAECAPPGSDGGASPMAATAAPRDPRDTTPKVVIETNIGSFTLELYYKHAPMTCKNFVELTRRGYYNGVAFHRIIKDFMIQGGDPSGTGRGGESIFGGPFKDEISKALKHTGAGILSMANAGPNTNRSQFFITLAPTPWLDGKHTIFGRVCSGMKTVAKLGLVETGAGDKPIHKVKIIKAALA